MSDDAEADLQTIPTLEAMSRKSVMACFIWAFAWTGVYGGIAWLIWR
jgi:hypothetical protein